MNQISSTAKTMEDPKPRRFAKLSRFHAKNQGELVRELTITETKALGTGGQSSVFKAQTKDGRSVALKIPTPDDDAAEKRLVREALYLSTLSHSNIIGLLDSDIFPGHTRLVLELIEGQDLEDVLGDSPLPWGRTAPIILQLCDALENVHSEGLVHRDVKPANVMLKMAGGMEMVKLIDFGLALSLDEPPEPNSIVGTPIYMAPEQVGRNVSQASDIYSLGVIIYRALSGTVPFAHPDPLETIRIKLNMYPMPPEVKNPYVKIPRILSELTMSMIARSANNRPTLAEVRDTIMACGIAPVNIDGDVITQKADPRSIEADDTIEYQNMNDRGGRTFNQFGLQN